MSAPDQILPAAIPGKPGLIVPNVLLRGALFSAAGGKRELLQRVRVASLSNIEITYTGARLGQGDLDIWHGLLCVSASADGWREFSARSFLAAIGRASGKTDRDWLETGVARLSATTVEVRHLPEGGGEGKVYGGSLIDEFVRVEGKDGWWRVRANPRLADLFAPNGWTLIDHKARAQLARRPLAQWLHAFYSTHATPIPYGAQKLMNLSGAGRGEVRRFRELLGPALCEVAAATGWLCTFDRSSDVVTVSKSQKLPKVVGAPPTPAAPVEGTDAADAEDDEEAAHDEARFAHASQTTPARREIQEDAMGIAYKPGNARDARLLSEIYEDFSEECIAEVVEFLRYDPYGGDQYYEDSTLRKIKGVPWNRGYVWPTAVHNELWKRAMPGDEEMREIQEKRADDTRSRLAAAAAEAGIQMRSAGSGDVDPLPLC